VLCLVDDPVRGWIVSRDGGAKEQLAGKKGFSTDELLQFYGWYKQLTQGDINTPQPGVWSIEARAKWNGWNKMKGLSPDACRARYLEQLSARVPQDWTNWPQLSSLKSELVIFTFPPAFPRLLLVFVEIFDF
jgi:diazepam-binding inhibitor (GABA receptor modulating acyl-CoA-binding protein)